MEIIGDSFETVPIYSLQEWNRFFMFLKNIWWQMTFKGRQCLILFLGTWMLDINTIKWPLRIIHCSFIFEQEHYIIMITLLLRVGYFHELMWAFPAFARCSIAVSMSLTLLIFITKGLTAPASVRGLMTPTAILA